MLKYLISIYALLYQHYSCTYFFRSAPGDQQFAPDRGDVGRHWQLDDLGLPGRSGASAQDHVEEEQQGHIGVYQSQPAVTG